MAPCSAVSQDVIFRFVTGLPGVATVTADEANGAPQVAWGDSFFYYDPDGNRPVEQLPFATLVVNDYPGFDTASRLDRAGVYRLNIAVGRHRFEELLGYPPAAQADHAAAVDYAALDQVLPHPVYAKQGWVSILNPGAATGAQALELVAGAHARAVRRCRPRR